MANAHFRSGKGEPSIRVPLRTLKCLRHSRQHHGIGLRLGIRTTLSDWHCGQRASPGQRIPSNQLSAPASSGNMLASSIRLIAPASGFAWASVFFHRSSLCSRVIYCIDLWLGNPIIPLGNAASPVRRREQGTRFADGVSHSTANSFAFIGHEAHPSKSRYLEMAKWRNAPSLGRKQRCRACNARESG